MQGIGIKWFTSRFSDSKLIRVSIVVMSLAYLMLVSDSISVYSIMVALGSCQ